MHRSSQEYGDGNLGANQVLSELSSTVTEVLSEKDMNIKCTDISILILIYHVKSSALNLSMVYIFMMWVFVLLLANRSGYCYFSEVHNQTHKNFKSW